MSTAQHALRVPEVSFVATRYLRERKLVVRSGGVVLIGTLVWQGSNFAFNSVAARLLGPGGYSELAATVALLYISSPVLLSVQTLSSRATTRLIVSGDETAVRVTLLAFSARLALLAAVIVAAAVGLSDLVAHFLHVRSAAAIAIVLCGLALSLLTHCQRGVLQGSGRFGRLALSTIVEALVKVGGAAAILTMSSRSVDGAVAAIPLAAGCTLLANAAMLRFLPRDASARAAGFRRPGSSIATVATFALLALLLSADILAAKRFLPPHAAGLYAAVSLCGKTTFFATSAVSVFLFPLFSAQRERGEPGRRLLGGAAALVIAVSVAMVTIFTFAPGIVLDPLFGARFAAVAPYLGTIAIAFGGYAVSYLTAMFLLARGRRIGVPVLSAVAAVQIGGLILDHGSVAAIVHVQLVTLTLGAVALLAAAVFAGDRS